MVQQEVTGDPNVGPGRAQQTGGYFGTRATVAAAELMYISVVTRQQGVASAASQRTLGDVSPEDIARKSMS